jgi:hypothetical protein
LISGPAPSLAESSRDLPADLRSLVEKALEKDPAERYQTARELVVDLRRLTRVTTSAKPGTTAAIAKRWKMIVPAAAAALVLGLRAKNCRTGDVLDEEQVQAARKEDVLDALSQIASRFRTRVGESLATVKQHDTPLEDATTPSLEALKPTAQPRRFSVRQMILPALCPFSSAPSS